MAETAPALARRALNICAKCGLTLGTVESCTGGMIGAALTAIPGSSNVVMAGLITYSNAAKAQLADVPPDLIRAHGAVSEAVVRAMADGGRKKLGVSVCVAVTGVAGPGGGSIEKPIGTVWLGIAGPKGVEAELLSLGPIGRNAIRRASTIRALQMIVEAAKSA
ncbi:MAG: CinA family protein [Bosea sp. (in: a-proteobacteria)]